MRYLLTSLAVGLAVAAPVEVEKRHRHGHGNDLNVQLGPRPFYLVDDMEEGPLKNKLESCSNGPFKTSNFVIAHRGAPLQFPEHSRESYLAAARQGAGTIECDVSFTKDKQLVCRHSHCDLATTTNILTIPSLASKCSVPFTPYNSQTGKYATATCCTTDITLADFKTLCAKMDGTPNPNATSLADYLHTPAFRTDLYATCGTPMTHLDSIELIDKLGLLFVPELKTPVVPMPYEGFTQEQYAQAMIDDYKNLNIDPRRVSPQSFLIDDVYYWNRAEPAFAKQAIFLDARVDTPAGYANATATLQDLADSGIRTVAPAFFALTELGGEENRTIVPSAYAEAAKGAGLKIVTWSFERSGPLKGGGDYYYQYVKPAIDRDGDMYNVLDVLVKQVGVKMMFSDWPATLTYYANCMGL